MSHERRLHRCPEEGCEAAFLTALQLRGHKSVHVMNARTVQEAVSSR